MLPSMPVLFTRDSQDAFGNKIEPSTSFFNQNSILKPVINPEPPPSKVTQVSKAVQKESKAKKDVKKNNVPNIEENALDTALVKSYYTKVQSRFSNTSVPDNKYIQFQNILKTFDPNKETPVELYRKIEQLFGDEHKDIVEEFLLFLKPGQAAEVGRFMDRFMLVQMTGFIELLHSTFARKPTVLRKIIRAITTGINSGSSDETKTRVLPHLRSNPRLTQMFKSLFPDERPPDSLYETGEDLINESFLTCDKGYDVWEYEEEPENKRKLETKEHLDSMYLHGRVFLQHGRLLRSARVTYPYSKEPYRVHARRLAPAHTHLSPPDSDEERSSPKRNPKSASKLPPKRPRKQLKSPTKTAKDVNGNTKVKDCTLLSPKTKKSQATLKMAAKTARKESDNKTDSNVKETEKSKKDKKENKSVVVPKKDLTAEGPKTKQIKLDEFEEKKDEQKSENNAIKVTADEAIEEPVNLVHKTDDIHSVDKKLEIKSNNWTRDEDKTMLQVLKGEAGSEKVFGRIRELLPHRSATEIKERFYHVMTLLQQMAVGEVT